MRRPNKAEMERRRQWERADWRLKTEREGYIRELERNADEALVSEIGRLRLENLELRTQLAAALARSPIALPPGGTLDRSGVFDTEGYYRVPMPDEQLANAR